ncbi:MAG: ribonuclease Z [Candidatus Woesearchaeota archaeon]|nr:MAG: ribonuclease Z [Candidatus Woesearchaeota archaeon]
MNELIFLGTGEAFNPELSTTSYLIKSGNNSIMIDAGYKSSHQLMKLMSKDDPSEFYLKEHPSHLLVTHLHGDHIAGIARLIVPAWELGRTKELKIYCPKEGFKFEYPVYGNLVDTAIGAHSIESRLHLDYGKLADVMEEQFPRKYTFWKNEQIIGDFVVSTAKTIHSAPNYALKFEYFGNVPSKNKKFAISGDGELTEDTKKLFEDVDLLVHEAFFINNQNAKNHATAKQVVDYAIEKGIPEVKLVQINKHELKKQKELENLFNFAAKNNVKVDIPKEFSNYYF